MRKKYRLLANLLAVIMLLSLTACGSAGETGEQLNLEGMLMAKPLQEGCSAVECGGISFSPFRGDFDDYYQLSFTGVRASSTLTADGETYRAKNAVDGRISTCWQEAAGGWGIGESLYMEVDMMDNVEIICIYPGYSDYFTQNGRPRTVEVVLSGGYSASFRLPDSNNWVCMKLDRPMKTDYIQIIIRDVYEGDYNEDTCISEVLAFGTYDDLRLGSQYFSYAFEDGGATSVLKDGGVTYRASNATDFNVATCWQEGVKGNGRGESVWGSLYQGSYISAVGIHPGYYEYYDANNRPRNVRICFSGGEYIDLKLPDENKEYVVGFREPVYSEYVELIILDTYSGRWNDDTCVTQLTAYGYY